MLPARPPRVPGPFTPSLCPLSLLPGWCPGDPCPLSQAGGFRRHPRSQLEQAQPCVFLTGRVWPLSRAALPGAREKVMAFRGFTPRGACTRGRDECDCSLLARPPLPLQGVLKPPLDVVWGQFVISGTQTPSARPRAPVTTGTPRPWLWATRAGCRSRMRLRVAGVGGPSAPALHLADWAPRGAGEMATLPGLPRQRGRLGWGYRMGKPSPCASAEGGLPGLAVSAVSLTWGRPIGEDVMLPRGAADRAWARLCPARTAQPLSSVGTEGPLGCVLGPEGPWEVSTNLLLCLLVWGRGPWPEALAIGCAGPVLTSQHVAAVWGQWLERGVRAPVLPACTPWDLWGQGQGHGREEWTESGPSPESGCARRREGGARTVLGVPEVPSSVFLKDVN